MANKDNIFQKYGIKEVANVYFEALEDEGKVGGYKAGDIVLFLDTLKVSTIETTAESTEARGGWGNPKLIMWDYNKDINITLEDALISMESLRLMMGGKLNKASATSKVVIHHTEEAVVAKENTVPDIYDHLTEDKLTLPPNYRYINLTTGERGRVTSNAAQEGQGLEEGQVQQSTFTAKENDRIRFFFEEERDGASDDKKAIEISISPNTFPGTYKVVGETFIKSQETGKDEAFQFIINKAKVMSEVTITLQAEGDPSTFSMTLNVLRSTNEKGEPEMMKLVKY